MTVFASDVCELSDNMYNALIHGERSMAVTSTSIFSNWVPFFAQLPQKNTNSGKARSNI